MTPQEVFEAEGYLIVGTSRELPLGYVARAGIDGFRPRGFSASEDAIYVVIGHATAQENLEFCQRYNLAPDDGPYFYKVIAE